MNRPARYIGNGSEAFGKDWIKDPSITNTQPIAVPVRLPRPSAIYGAKGRMASPPNPGIAPIMPSFELIGLWKTMDFVLAQMLLQRAVVGFT